MPNTAIIAQADADSLALPALVDRAAAVLSNARSSAEVLEARDMASVAYDAAKKAARFAKAKNAADSLIAAAHRAQADARSHWSSSRGGTALGDETQAILDHIERVANVRGLITAAKSEAA
jgi:hypothetical protein